MLRDRPDFKTKKVLIQHLETRGRATHWGSILTEAAQILTDFRRIEMVMAKFNTIIRYQDRHQRVVSGHQRWIRININHR